MRKPKTTERTLDFAFSFASLLTGKTRIIPIQTMTPIAITPVTICTRRITAATIVRKSEFCSVTARSIFDSERGPILVLQFLNSLRISPQTNTQSDAYASGMRNPRVTIHRLRRIYWKNFIIDGY